jgi:hypothetical protein
MRMERGDIVCFVWVGGRGVWDFCVFGWVDGLILMRIGNDRGKGRRLLGILILLFVVEGPPAERHLCAAKCCAMYNLS